MGHIARLRLIRDRFIAGHDSCALRRHLDCVAPETPIPDIVERCRVWESHADTEARRFSKPGPERALPICNVDKPGSGLDDWMVAAVAISWKLCSDDCSPPRWCRRRLPNQYPRNWKVCYNAYWRECRHRRPSRHPRPLLQNTDMATLLQGLLPGIPAARPGPIPGPMRRNWATVVCFSCGKAGHGVGRCPELKESFPCMLPGWTAEKVGGSYVMISPRVAAERRRAENGD